MYSAERLALNEKYTDIYSEIENESEEHYYVFTAPVSGDYKFSTIESDTDFDTFGELLNERGSSLL